MAKRQFKAESKRLLDLMINSIYTHKEIFIRELISNASDAIDKLYYKSLKEGISGLARDDFFIKITVDKENRTLTIEDNGIGMDKDSLEKNLGTIAKSGSLQFKNDEEVSSSNEANDIDIIGQFGGGSYSTFMVANDIKVISRAYGSEDAYEWESSGADGYSISEGIRDSNGTTIIIDIKEDTENENYSDYLESYRLRSLVKKYSDYIRYPIKMDIEKTRYLDKEEGAPEEEPPKSEKYIEEETLNSMVPIWKRNKSELSNDDYNDFYKQKFMDYEDPLKVIHTSVEGAISYDALLFIPKNAPYNYYTKDFEKGLQLYSSGVMIMEKSSDLLPDYFSFVKGLVDSQDLNLNISREMLQQDRQLKAIEKRLETKIASELKEMLQKDREQYEAFFKSFGLQLKFGVYQNYGANKDKLVDLLLFHSSTLEKLVTLSEYVSRMEAEQKYIYYATGENIDKLSKLPQTELLKDKGFEILYGTDEVDEFAFKMLMNYEEKEFKSVSDSDLGIEESEEEKEKTKELEEDTKDLFEAMKAALDGKVKEVKLSSRLKIHPVILASGEGISLEMEKVLMGMPGADELGSAPKAERILEINKDHPILDALKKTYKSDKENLANYAKILYDQALLMAGLPIDDPVAFSNAICTLIEKV